MCGLKLLLTIGRPSKVCEVSSGTVGSRYLDCCDTSWKCFLLVNPFTALPLYWHRCAQFLSHLACVFVHLFQ